jgi:hypothetical protein
MPQDTDIDAAADRDGGEVDFPIPKGYNLPSSAQDGKEFTALASFRLDDDNDDDNEDGPMLVLTKIEGVDVSTEPPEEEEGPETSPEMLSALQQPQATNASSGMPAASTY